MLRSEAKVTAVSGSRPLSVAEAKNHLRVSNSDEDTYIEALIDSAVETAERYTGRKLVRCTIKDYISCWAYPIPLTWPIVSVLEVAYVNSNGTEKTDGLSYYEKVDSPENRRLYRKADVTLPTLESKAFPITVTYTSGYADGDCPKALIQAIRLMIGENYEYREDRPFMQQVQTSVGKASERLMRQYRIKEF